MTPGRRRGRTRPPHSLTSDLPARTVSRVVFWALPMMDHVETVDYALHIKISPIEIAPPDVNYRISMLIHGGVSDVR